MCLAFILHPSSLILKADLVSNNPFVPEGWKPPSERVVATPTPPPAKVTLELRGTDEWNGVKSFYLFDSLKNIGTWVTLNDQSATTPVLAVDDTSESTSVSVRINGELKKLTLKKSDGKPLEVKTLAEAPKAPPPPTPQPGGIPPPNGAQSGGNPPGPGGGPGGFDRSQIPGYNASLPANDPANIAAMRTYFEARRGERDKEGASKEKIQFAVPPTAPTANSQPDNPQRRPLLNENHDKGRDKGRGR